MHRDTGVVSRLLGDSWPEDRAPSLQSERRGTTPASGGPLAEEGKADSMGRGLSHMGETLAHTEDPEIKSK